MRIVKVFWGLDASLAYKRHFPAINWLSSYSLYLDLLKGWYSENVDEDWMNLRGRMMSLLQDEAELEEIVKLVGMDALSAGDRLKMETARSIREDFLHQLAFHEVDTYTSLKKQLCMMRLILAYYDLCKEALEKNASIDELASLAVREKIGRFKYIKEENVDSEYNNVMKELEKEVLQASAKGVN